MVLVDRDGPRADGTDLRRPGERPGVEGLVAILTLPVGTVVDVERYRDSGFARALTKPVKPSPLLAAYLRPEQEA